jgi:hypothetical protein
VSYIAGIGVGYAVYSPNVKGKNAFAVGVHYVNYGKFEGASETGQLTGTFSAAEYAINLFYSRVLAPQLRAGIDLKPIFSSLESYNSFGLAADLGITYAGKDGLTAASLVIRNLGGQITTYYQNGDHEKLPWNIQLGFSKKLAHAPVRFFVTANHLNKWDLSYLNRPGEESSTAESSENFVSILMRHFVFGAEILPEKHLTLRLGYNYQRQKELSIDSRPGLVGFSAGIGVKIAKFSLSYGIASYHLGATGHYFSLATNLSQFVH